MSKLGEALIKGLQDALAYERGEIELRTSTVGLNEKGELVKYEGTNREVAAPGGKMMRDGQSNIGAGETMGKEERVEVEADGKRELDVGGEALDKVPKKKKSLIHRWQEIKKSLDNKSAILDLDSLTEDEQEQPEDASTQPNPESDEDGGAVPDDQEQSTDDARPEWLPEGVEHEGEQGQAEEGQEEGGGEEEEPQEDEDSEAAEQEIEEGLRQMGHSEAEIKHIIHGHMVPQVDPVDRAKVEHESFKTEHDNQAHEKEMAIRDEESKIETDHAKRMKEVEYARAQKEAGETDMELEHKKRLQELEYNKAKEESSVNDAKMESEHKKRLQDLEYEKAKAESSFNEAKVQADHKKRMLDLEYENAKKAKQLELEFKQKEYDMKLKHSEQLAQEKHKAAMETAKQDAKMQAEQKKQEMKLGAETKKMEVHQKHHEKKSELEQRAVDHEEDMKIKAKQSEEDRKLRAKETAQQRAKASASDKKVKKSDDEADDLQKAAPSWKHSKSMINGQSISSISHPEHGVISVLPNEAGGFDMKHTGPSIGGGGAKNLGSFKDSSALKGALGDYMESLTGPVQLTHPKPKLSVVPNSPADQRIPAAAKPVVGAPAAPKQASSFGSNMPHKRKLYDPDLSGNVAKAEQASRGEEWRSQQDSNHEPHEDEPADEESKGEKSNIAEDEKKDAKMQLGVSTVNSHNKSKYRGDKENVE